MRYYSSTAVDTALTVQINSSNTSVSVGSVTGYPTQFPFTIVIDPDTANEELVEVTAAAGTTFTVTRGFDNTTAVAHAVGAAVKHVLSASDLAEPQEHIAATENVHGIADTAFLVTTNGTQTLTNKTINYNQNTITNLPVSAAGWTLINSASPSGTSTVSWTSLSGYNSYMIEWYAGGTADSYMNIQFNSDTGNNYWMQRAASDGSVPYIATSQISQITWPQNNSGGSKRGGHLIVSGCNTSSAKAVRGVTGGPNNSYSAEVMWQFSGAWTGSATVTSISMSLLSGNFNSSTLFRLYGSAA